MNAPFFLFFAFLLMLWPLPAAGIDKSPGIEPVASTVSELEYTPVSETVVFASKVNGAEAYAYARATVWLVALRRAATLLLDRREMLMGDTAPQDRLALAAQLYTADVWSLTLPNEEGKPQSLRLTVTLYPIPDTKQELAHGLRNVDMLALRRMLLEEITDALAAAPKETAENFSAIGNQLDGLWFAQNAMKLTAEGWIVASENLPDMENAARLAPKSPLVYLLLGEARLRKGLPQQCAQACDEALRLDSSLSRARYIRALAHWRLQQFALAEDDLNASLAEGHGAPQGEERIRRLQARGALRMLRGNNEGMCEDYAAACSLGDCDGMETLRVQGLCRAEQVR